MNPRAASDLLPPLPELATGSRLLVAYSGGLDSTVLLHLLAQRRAPGLTAIHVHHGLQAAADVWAGHCEAFCQSLVVPMVLCRAKIAADDEAGPEAAAREARYALLRTAMQPGDLLVTAHHRDDQAETVLLRLLRGSGVHGLSGIRPLTDFIPGRLWRPLLDQPRKRLRDYAIKHSLRWIEDPHNVDPRYTRIWLRQGLLPGLRERFPQADRSFARSARLAAEAADLLDERAAEDHASCARNEVLSVIGLLSLSAPRRHNLLRWWLHRQGFLAPFAEAIDRVGTELLIAPRDAEPLIRWPGCELRRYRDGLYAMRPLPPPPEAGDWGIWQDSTRFDLPNACGYLESEAPPSWPLRVRSPRPGETIRLATAANTRSLRNLFQERGIPPWLRLRIPVVEAGEGATCLPGVGSTAAWRESLAGKGWQGRWHHGFAGLGSPLSL